MIGKAYVLIVHLYNRKSGAASTRYPIEVNKLAHKYGLPAILGKFALVIRYLVLDHTTGAVLKDVLLL